MMYVRALCKIKRTIEVSVIILYQVFSIKQWKNHDRYELSVPKNVVKKIFFFKYVAWLSFLSFSLLLYWVLVAAPLIVAWRIFFSFGMWTVPCSMWNLVPWPGIKPGPPPWIGSLSTGPPEKSPFYNLNVHIEQRNFILWNIQ